MVPSGMSSDASKSSITGTNAAAKDVGYRGFQHFSHFSESCHLRIWENDDVQECRTILRGMGYGSGLQKSQYQIRHITTNREAIHGGCRERFTKSRITKWRVSGQFV